VLRFSCGEKKGGKSIRLASWLGARWWKTPLVTPCRSACTDALRAHKSSLFSPQAQEKARRKGPRELISRISGHYLNPLRERSSTNSENERTGGRLSEMGISRLTGPHATISRRSGILSPETRTGNRFRLPVSGVRRQCRGSARGALPTVHTARAVRAFDDRIGARRSHSSSRWHASFILLCATNLSTLKYWSPREAIARMRSAILTPVVRPEDRASMTSVPSGGSASIEAISFWEVPPRL
jgi:hypothetical protein